MAITCHIFECNALHYKYVMGKKCPLQITFHYFENVIYYNYITITITITPGLHARTEAQSIISFLQYTIFPSVKGITSTSYFSAHFKNTTFGVMERKFLCSGDVLDLVDLTDRAK